MLSFVVDRCLGHEASTQPPCSGRNWRSVASLVHNTLRVLGPGWHPYEKLSSIAEKSNWTQGRRILPAAGKRQVYQYGSSCKTPCMKISRWIGHIDIPRTPPTTTVVMRQARKLFRQPFFQVHADCATKWGVMHVG
jgi:hypothetical protein